MFREGRHVQENKRCYEKVHVFFLWFFFDVRWQIEAKIVEKARKMALCTKIDKDSTFGSRFFTKCRFFVDFWGPSGSLGASRDVREPPRSLHFFHKFSIASENRPGPAPGRPQGGPGCPPGTSRASFWVDFGSIFRVDFHNRRIPSEVARNSKKMRRGHKSLAELSQRLPGYCLWLQCCVLSRDGPLLTCEPWWVHSEKP